MFSIIIIWVYAILNIIKMWLYNTVIGELTYITKRSYTLEHVPNSTHIHTSMFSM